MSATDIGINFRATSGYVTDGTDETYCRADDAYPTTRGGWTFGWEAIPAITNDRDRTTITDRRLAGVNFSGSTTFTDARFRVDLPSAGNYDIHAAFGDDQAQPDSYFRFLDTTTVLFTSSERLAINFAQFVDATDTLHTSPANWVANESLRNEDFATTIFRCDIANAPSGGAANTMVAHLRLVQQSAGSSVSALIGGKLTDGGILMRGLTR
jgi:hypothetical protein